jgi:hypothetical protein
MPRKLECGRASPVFLVGADGNLVASANAIFVEDTWEIVQLGDATLNDNDKTITLPAGYQYHILSIQVDYTAVAGVDRQIQINFMNAAGAVFFQVRPNVVVPASTQYIYDIGPAMSDDTAVRDGNNVSVAMLTTMLMNAGERIRIFDNNAVSVNDDMIIMIRLGRKPV